MEDTQSSVTEVDISNNSDMYSSIDWAQPPIFARRYNAITHVSSCSFYHRPTDVANHVLFEDAKAQTWVSAILFMITFPVRVMIVDHTTFM
jgi:hypothetical protein